MNKLIELFQEEPRQWGLRGDPFLWNDLKVHFVNKDIPKTKSELESLLKRTFKDFVDEEIDSGKQIYIKKYAEGGMSSGMVDCNFWYEKAIPLLINTYSKILEMEKHETIRVQHRFINHQIDLNTETLILGTFNPEASNNDADFFYGRSRNYLWRLLPNAFSKPDLKGAPKKEKLEFIKEHNIDLTDLIEEIEVEQGQEANYYDGYIDSKVTRWKKINSLIATLPNLKRVCFTRKTFSDIPNIKKQISAIKDNCTEKGIAFRVLTTPARFYREDKQAEWTSFLLDNR